jgi:hypothetical protein
MTPAIPSPLSLREAPQLAALAVLDASILTAEAMLLAHHSELEDLAHIFHPERAPPDTFLVPILLAHFDELRYLLDRYRLAIRDALLGLHDPIPF